MNYENEFGNRLLRGDGRISAERGCARGEQGRVADEIAFPDAEAGRFFGELEHLSI
jgi:hypothetical protein